MQRVGDAGGGKRGVPTGSARRRSSRGHHPRKRGVPHSAGTVFLDIAQQKVHKSVDVICIESVSYRSDLTKFMMFYSEHRMRKSQSNRGKLSLLPPPPQGKQTQFIGKTASPSFDVNRHLLYP